MPVPNAFDLYLDESGTFTETSTDAAEQADAQKGRVFPSQLAGLLVPRGELTPGKAREVLTQSLAVAGLPPQPVHARDLPRHAYDAIVVSVVERLHSRGWQPVRLANRERVRYGDRVAAYTHLLAELVLRICQQKAREGVPRLSLRLYPARVRMDESATGVLTFLDRDDYLRRVQGYLGFAAVRHGLAGASHGWRLEGLHLRSGKDDPELQLCDLLSHASHADFHPCNSATADALRQALGAYDFSLTFLELIERVDHQLAGDALGLAVLSLAERFCGDAMSDELRVAAQERLRQSHERLAALGAPARDQHLALLAGWVEQTVEVHRNLTLGRRLAAWLLTEVVAPVNQALQGGPEAGSLAWFAYALRTWALTACNHAGDLHGSREQARELRALLPGLAGQWEHGGLLMRGLVAEAVHRTDCFEYDDASARMEAAAGYYGQLGALFPRLLPEVFPQRVRSDLHGRALGTWLQSEILAGLCHADTARLERARELSERAIDEFPAQADKERQYQYRSQLETAAGNYAEARRWLARSLRLADDSHEALAGSIAALAEVSAVAEGFAQLHWFRLGVSAFLADNRAEAEAFRAAVEKAGALDWRWSRADGPEDYPAHGILRRVAILRGLRGEAKPATDALRRLAGLLSGSLGDHLVLETVRLAAHAETAATLAPRNRKAARRLLDNSEADLPGLAQLLVVLKAQATADFPALWQAFADWPVAVERALATGPDESAAYAALVSLSRRIG